MQFLVLLACFFELVVSLTFSHPFALLLSRLMWDFLQESNMCNESQQLYQSTPFSPLNFFFCELTPLCPPGTRTKTRGLEPVAEFRWVLLTARETQ